MYVVPIVPDGHSLFYIRKKRHYWGVEYECLDENEEILHTAHFYYCKKIHYAHVFFRIHGNSRITEGLMQGKNRKPCLGYYDFTNGICFKHLDISISHFPYSDDIDMNIQFELDGTQYNSCRPIEARFGDFRLDMEHLKHFVKASKTNFKILGENNETKMICGKLIYGGLNKFICSYDSENLTCLVAFALCCAKNWV